MATFVCPVCGALAKIYASRPMSETAREMFIACTNERCEHSFRSLYDVLNTILPSALPADDPERLPPGDYELSVLLRNHREKRLAGVQNGRRAKLFPIPIPIRIQAPAAP